MNTGHVGILVVEIWIPYASSLKDKRQVLRSLKDRVRSGNNVSVAEIAFHDKWQRSSVGICMIGADRVYVETHLSKLLDFIRSMDGFEISGHAIDFLC